MAKVVCVLYDDPVDGYPTRYARDGLPKLERYPGGQTLPTPKAIDFHPGVLLGSVSGELGLRKFLESQGHSLVVTSDKDGPDCVFEHELLDAEIVISQPFWPAYLTAERIAKANKLKLAITAGIGSDHVDLQAAMDRGITVAEVTYCNSISVSEHVVMMILGLVRNYIPSYQWVVKGGWNIADCVARSYDVEGMHVGTVARRADRHRGAAPAEAVRRQAALHRPPPASRGGRKGTRRHLPQDGGGNGACLRCRHHQRPAASGDGKSLRRGDDRQDEARRLSGEHGARQDLQSRRHRPRAGERPTCRLCRRRLVPAAGAQGPSLADRCRITA